MEPNVCRMFERINSQIPFYPVVVSFSAKIPEDGINSLLEHPVEAKHPSVA